MKKSCNGKPSASNYGNGCRCADCREAWRIHSEEDRVSKRKSTGSRDKPLVFSDAFTREEILRARG
mgnify:FL=1|jgi:hypothetical protein